MMKRKWAVLGAVVLMACGNVSAGWAAGSLKKLAKSFSRSAREAGAARLAVMAFRPMDDSSPAEGIRLSERVITQLAKRGTVDVMERTLLEGLLDEQRLGMTGAFDADRAGRLGGMLQADAVVTATFATAGDRVEIHARLVHLETGAILSAESVRIKRDYHPAAGRRIPDRRNASEVFALRKNAAVEEFQLKPGELRDAVSEFVDDPCAGVSRRIDALQAEILDLKSRYWAQQILEANAAGRTLDAKPGALIRDPRLKEKFHRMLEADVKRKAPPLTASETNRFIVVDADAFMLSIRCSRSPGLY